ncbi:MULTISPECIES: guanitoxin biosynthesis PLP-dependent transaminase GntE [Caldilinea]|jgi:glutamate-1-semialdehyde 2,1-aminomutase|uniref:glutamate-1-semialdehyde 2,1-aminomutase n=1 Tax=Caldilinea aerophila (strain DSM 14535 / JCM 11387 / NBRC 104270 / STL-6-O1) TaxID=926550 RepID=I0I960_CALAS|nr:MULTISPECIES: guanitoxin biosynthesis PLP-dependent transaminase GntE [Caldilinea]MBO9391878.1 aspartate aminotransferase family protein [Caldilinea sp.]BAM01798.1 glutamate-1-semialdehyde 2,1-aminomutase [Caldilinea aerophila DSM 14535 = NBRC 104270]GIV73132.1 MAG: glutamate-1-semialdehyde 2,1-aminomutase [Caldilinea sp.]
MNPVKTRTHQLFAKAKQYIPYGVNSNFRYWGDENTPILTRGAGAYVWDADDNRYIDYRLGFGPIILGHAYPEVTRRVAEAIQNGVLFAATTPIEIELAERFTRMTGMDKVRLSNTGTEANMHALRIARAYTGREKFIKFEGNYHGNFDYVMFSGPTAKAELLGPRNHPHRLRATEGMPVAIRNYMISLPYNDIELLERAMVEHSDELAAVIVEPIMGNVACILPDPAWLRRVRELCDEFDIVLIFDEVKTGFRLAPGGAQQYFGVKADLAAYAKAMGNGFPVSAVAGREEIMAVVEPGRVAHGGTYCGNVVAATAAAATLEIIETQPVIETIFANGRRLIDGIHTILRQVGAPHVISGVPSMFSVLLGKDEPPTDYRSYAEFDSELFGLFGAELIRRGVLIDDDPREPWFLSFSHDAAVIDESLNLIEDAAKAVFRTAARTRRLAA